MKTRVLTMVVALVFVLLASDTASAGRLFYRRVAPGRLYFARPVVVAPVYPVVTPLRRTIVGPNVVVGPLGRIRYVAPVRVIGAPVYLP
jgi:hypothetical protein